MLGTFEINKGNLIFESNSVERTERGVALIRSWLDAYLIGAPISVHENIELARTSASVTPAAQPIDVNEHPELQEMMLSMMKDHYLKTLDEAIPMLDNESPRACAEDPDKQHKVIDWLKYLENSESKSPNPSQDFTRMWEELGLTDYR